MKVQLANCTLNPVEEIFRAYKICYAKGEQDAIKIPYRVYTELDSFTLPDYDKMGEFIKPLMANGHTSPLEHVSLTFYINGVSRALTHQLVRHRTGKFNQQSQRYVKFGQFEYVIPPEIAKIPMAKGLFIYTMKESQSTYDALVEMLISNGRTEKQAIEDARYVFPNACCSNITVTFDLNNFRKFYALRGCRSAQWEIRELAEEMMRQVKVAIPFADYLAKGCGRTCNECWEK